MAVFPKLLYTRYDFREDRDIEAVAFYDGHEAGIEKTARTKHFWDLEVELVKTDMDALWTFIGTRKGPGEAFYWYDLENNGFYHDPTGIGTTGRYLTIFAQDQFTKTRLAQNRHIMSFSLEETDG